MTPSQHKTQAETMLTAYEGGDPGRQYDTDQATLIQAHTQLGQAAGTGSHYTAAEAALAKYAACTITYDRERAAKAALAHGMLADR